MSFGPANGSCCAATAPNTPPPATRSTSPTARPARSPASPTTDHRATRRRSRDLAHRPLPRPRRPPHPRLRPHHPPGPRRHLGSRHRRRRRRPLPRRRLRRDSPAGDHENWIILTDPEAAELARQAAAETERHDTGLTPPDDQPGDIDDDLIQPITRSGAKTPRPHHRPRRPPRRPPRRHPPVRRPRSTRPPRTHRRTPRHRAARRPTATALVEQLERLDHVAERIAVGIEVSPADRHNVGTVTAIDDARWHRRRRTSCQTTGEKPTATFHWARPPHRRRHAIGTHELTPAAAHHARRTVRRHPRAHRRLAHHPRNPRSRARRRRPVTAERSTGGIDRAANTPRCAPTRLDSDTSSETDPSTSPEPTPGTTPSATSHAGVSHTDLTPRIPGLGASPDRIETGEAWDRLHGAPRPHPDLARHHRPHTPDRPSHDPTPTAHRPSRRTRRTPRHRPRRLATHHPSPPQTANSPSTTPPTLLQTALNGQDARRAWIIATGPTSSNTTRSTAPSTASSSRPSNPSSPTSPTTPKESTCDPSHAPGRADTTLPPKRCRGTRHSARRTKMRSSAESSSSNNTAPDSDDPASTTSTYRST